MSIIQTRGEYSDRSMEKSGGDRHMDRGDRGDRDRDGDERSQKRGSFNRKKVCRFCADQDYVMDYKETRIMQSFLTEHGKIVPRRISGNCALHQRKLTSEIKRARNLALVGFISND